MNRDPGWSPNNGLGIGKFDESDLPDCPRCMANDNIAVMRWHQDEEEWICDSCWLSTTEDPHYLSPADWGVEDNPKEDR